MQFSFYGELIISHLNLRSSFREILFVGKNSPYMRGIKKNVVRQVATSMSVPSCKSRGNGKSMLQSR